jgi:CRISPR system Cascade subunit CasD
MSTLLLRLSGPMQSWGTQSKFDVRDTGYEPSKSGVIGLICAALGRPRYAPIADLAGLMMGVRVDRQGVLKRDYHTAGKGGYYRVSGSVERVKLIVSSRYYLADAVFLVGLEGEQALLEDIHDALRDPVWMLYLGRKAFVPGEPVWLPDGLQPDYALMEAFRSYLWLGGPRRWADQVPEWLRVVRDDPDGEIVRHDLPISFAERKFYPRRMTTEFVPTPLPREESV